MKKTIKRVVIGQLNRKTGNYTHIDRRVYADEKGIKYVRVNGCFFKLADYASDPNYTVDIYF